MKAWWHTNTICAGWLHEWASEATECRCDWTCQHARDCAGSRSMYAFARSPVHSLAFGPVHFWGQLCPQSWSYRFIGDKNAEVILNIWMCRWACWKLTCSRICVHLLVPLAHPFPELSGFELSTVAKIYKLSTPSGGFFRKQVCKLIRPHHCFSDNN